MKDAKDILIVIALLLAVACELQYLTWVDFR